MDESVANKKLKNRQNSGWGRSALRHSDCCNFDELQFRATITVIGYTRDDGTKIEISAPAADKNENAQKITNPKLMSHRKNGANVWMLCRLSAITVCAANMSGRSAMICCANLRLQNIAKCFAAMNSLSMASVGSSK